MQIDSLNSIWYGGPEYSRPQRAQDKEALSALASGESVGRSSFAPILEQAQRMEIDDADAVRQARQALEAGELDKPEAIRDAAARMVQTGI